jgi:hypothetical protein
LNRRQEVEVGVEILDQLAKQEGEHVGGRRLATFLVVQQNRYACGALSARNRSVQGRVVVQLGYAVTLRICSWWKSSS